MGSSGSGTVGNYRPSEKARCDEPIATDLEEIARGEYFSGLGTVPPVGTKLQLHKGTVEGRLIVGTIKKPEIIGLLPTSFHHHVLDAHATWHRTLADQVAPLKKEQTLEG